jgi:PAS domain S-box-containing protein
MSQLRQYDRGARRPTEGGSFSPGRRLLLSVIVAIIGVALSLLLSWLLLKQEEQIAEARFQDDAARRVEAVQRAVTDRLNTMEALAVYYAGSELVERGEFHTFVPPQLAKRPGIRALGWAPHIRAAQRSAHEQFARREGVSKYEITERDERGSPIPARARAEYWPILFIEPPDKNQSLLGFDIRSSASCRDAMQRATDTGKPASGVCTVLGKDPMGCALLYVVMPAKNAENDVSRGADRPADQPEADGFVFGIFDMGAIVEAALLRISPVGIDVTVVAPSSLGTDKLVCMRTSPLAQQLTAESAERVDKMQFEGKIDVADRQWRVRCVPLKAFLAQYRTWGPAGMLLAGLLVTALLVGYLALLTGLAARIERLVTERTYELHASEQRFRRLVDNAADTFVLHTPQGKILDVNKHACESLGYTREELLSMSIADIDVEYVRKNFDQHAQRRPEEYPVSFEGVHRRKDGTTFPVEIRLTCLAVDGERLMLGLARDTSERKRMEQMLREGERKLSAILDQTFQFIGLITPEGILVESNKSSLTFSDVSAESVRNMPFWETPWWTHSPALQERLRQAVKKAAQGEFIRMEVTHLAANGELHWIDFSLKPVSDEAGKVIFLIPEGRDITGRKQMEEALDGERRLLRKMLDMQEQDRKLVAYEIHDGLAQQLAAALFKLQSINEFRDSDPDGAHRLFDESVRLLREAMAETRRLISGLRPPILDDSGVVDAIEYLISEQQPQGGPEVEYVHVGPFHRVAAPLEDAIFRIVQEALTNARKHSQSQRVRVSLSQGGGRVHVEIRDWGVGFDPTKVKTGHYGLHGIRERARLLDGVVAIESTAGRGTRISVDFPLLLPNKNVTAEDGPVHNGTEPGADATESA